MGTLGENVVREFCLNVDFHATFRDILHAANLRHGTDGFTSPPKEGVLRIFSLLKNPKASAGFEPANLGTKGQHATPRPTKPLTNEDIATKFEQEYVRCVGNEKRCVCSAPNYYYYYY